MVIPKFMKRAAAASCVFSFALAAGAQSYPTKPIRLIVPFPAGGVTDTASRIVGKELSVLLGQAVAVDNKPGASGIMGTALAAQAAPDGYTLLMGNISTLAVNAVAYKKIPYDPRKSFIPVSMVASQPIVLAAKTGSPACRLDAFRDLAASKDGGLNFGSGGASFELANASLKNLAGFTATNIRYKGDVDAMMSLLAGDVDYILGSLSTLRNFIGTKEICAVGILSTERSPLAPAIPTLKELGVPVFSTSWQSIVVPEGTPAPVVAKLEATLNKVLQMPEVRNQFARQGVTATASSAKELGIFIDTELKRWSDIAAATGFKAE